MIKKINIPRLIWIACLFLLLIVILLMIMDYKINYQYLYQNMLYFYECDDGNLCVSETIQEDNLLLSTYDCGYEECPLFNEDIGDGYVLFSSAEKLILYKYDEEKIISDSYDSYEVINDAFVIVSKDDYYGIINISDEIIVDLIYEEIGYRVDDSLAGYSDEKIIAKKDGKYGIVSLEDGSVVEKFEYYENNIEVLLEMIAQN